MDYLVYLLNFVNHITSWILNVIMDDSKPLNDFKVVHNMDKPIIPYYDNTRVVAK